MPHPRSVHKGLVLVTCSLSLMLVMMDVTIVNVVLPSIRQALSIGVSELQWIVDAYSLVVAGLLMTGGAIADRFGRKRVFMAGIIVFCLGSALCGAGSSASLLIIARAMQGVGGAMLNPVALSIIANVFVDPKERARAIGVWGMISGASLALGPMVGGFVSDLAGWRAVFWINVPIGAVALAMTVRFVPESRAPLAAPLDPAGQGCAAIAVACLAAALIEGPDAGWTSALVFGLLVASAGATLAFVKAETTLPAPMLDFRFFRSLPFAFATIIAVMCFAEFSSLLFLNTIYLQDIRGLSARQAGLWLMPFALAAMVCAPISGRLIASFGARVPLLLASVGLAGGAFLLIGLTVDMPFWRIAVAYGLTGAGFGLCNAPITNAAVSGMPRARAGVAAAVASTSRQVGAALGVAAAGTVRSGAIMPGTDGFAAAFLAATHPIWWGTGVLGVAIGVCGLLATGKAAHASARHVAALFEQAGETP